MSKIRKKKKKKKTEFKIARNKTAGDKKQTTIRQAKGKYTSNTSE